MSKYECPECCGEGFELDRQIDSNYPAMFICEICDGLGWVDEILVCSVCKACDYPIDLDDPEYEDIIKLDYCREHKPAFPMLRAEDICAVQPMTGTISTINYTSAISSGNAVFNNNDIWHCTS